METWTITEFYTWMGSAQRWGWISNPFLLLRVLFQSQHFSLPFPPSEGSAGLSVQILMSL